jgi:PAS domain S-box-containing protein
MKDENKTKEQLIDELAKLRQINTELFVSNRPEQQAVTNVLSGKGWQDICAQFHRLWPQTECRCKQSDSYIFDHLHEGSYVGYKCMNGLMNLGTPIMLEDQPLSSIFLRQFLHELIDEEFLRQQAQEFGFDEVAYMEALSRIPIIPEDQKFFKAFHCNPDIMSIATLSEGRYVAVNDAFVEIIGYERQDVIGHTALELGIWVVPEKRNYLSKQIQEHGSIRGFELELRGKSGNILTCNLSGNLIDIDGEAHLIVTTRDISKQKQTEEALRLSEECFRMVFNSVNDAIFIQDIETGVILKANNAFYSIIGHNHEEVIGKTSLELGFWLNSADRYLVKERIMAKQSIQEMEIRFCKKSEEQRLGLYSAEGLEINGEPCILSVLTDITDLRQMEVEMARLDRLNLVGEIAASIGHEIRNPMTTVRGYLQLLRENKDYSQEIEYFDLMIEELDRANSIITEFLSLAKNKMVDMKSRNLNSIISKSLPLILCKAMSKDQYIKLELHDHDLPDLLLDKKEIRQLILNLVNNGMESMSLPGDVTIRTFIENEKVVLAVQDQGHGIARELLDKIGTPFFTTKEQGTGLGLAVCYRIANRHNAKMDINTSSTGTTFYVRFPIPIVATRSARY